MFSGDIGWGQGIGVVWIGKVEERCLYNKKLLIDIAFPVMYPKTVLSSSIISDPLFQLFHIALEFGWRDKGETRKAEGNHCFF